MSSNTQDRVEHVLKKWYKSKQDISSLEKECKKYKQFIGKLMDNRDTNSISRGEYTTNRRHDSRKTLSKSSVPAEIWEKYSSVVYYDTYYVKLKKD